MEQLFKKLEELSKAIKEAKKKRPVPALPPIDPADHPATLDEKGVKKLVKEEAEKCSIAKNGQWSLDKASNDDKSQKTPSSYVPITREEIRRLPRKERRSARIRNHLNGPDAPSNLHEMSMEQIQNYLRGKKL